MTTHETGLPHRIPAAGPAHDPLRGYLARGRIERSLAVWAAFGALARTVRGWLAAEARGARAAG